MDDLPCAVKLHTVRIANPQPLGHA